MAEPGEGNRSDTTVLRVLTANYKAILAKSNLNSQGSSYMAGCVNECLRIYAGELESFKSCHDSNVDAYISRKRIPDEAPETDAIDRNDGSLLLLDLDFSKSVSQLKTVLETWEDLMMRAIDSRQYLLRLEILKWSLMLLKFILKVRQHFLDNVQQTSKEASAALGNSKINIKVCYLDTRHLRLLTRLFCETLNQTIRNYAGEHVKLLLHLFMDALESLISGALQSVKMDVTIIQDWLFLLSFPWLKKLTHAIPSCKSVPSLNTACDNAFVFDARLRQRCLLLLRFEGFFIFCDCVTELLKYEMRYPSRDATCKSILQIIAGFWWPLEQFEWRELLVYCLSVFSSDIWLKDLKVAIALAEAIVRLPCIYCHKKVVLKTNRAQQPIAKPRSKGCHICDDKLLPAVGPKFKSKLKSVKMNEEDTKILRLLIYKMLSQLNTAVVQSRLVTMLIRLRKHGNMNLASFTMMFWKILSRTSSSTNMKVVNMYGFCTRQKDRPSRINHHDQNTKNPSSYRTEKHNARIIADGSKSIEGKKKSNSDTSFNIATATRRPVVLERNQSAEQLGLRQRSSEMASLVKRKSFDSSTSSTSIDLKRRKLDSINEIRQKDVVKKLLNRSTSKGHNIVKSNPNQQVVNVKDLKKVISSYSAKPYLNNMNSAFINLPPPGRFDAAALLYNNLLYRFHFSNQTHQFLLRKVWIGIAQYHIVFKHLAQYADGDVLMAEVLKYHLHLLARLRMMHGVVMVQRTLRMMAKRAGCEVGELCGRFREVLAEEMTNLCFDVFFPADPSVSIDESNCIEECREFFFKVRLVIGWSTTHMEDNLLRGIIKRCVLLMFEDRRAKIIITAIAEYGKWGTVSRLLQVELAHYYTHLVFNSTNVQSLKTLLTNLHRTYHCNPKEISQLHQQYFHIEFLSNLFDNGEHVIQQYDQLLKWMNIDKNESRDLVHAIESSLAPYYVGVLINFERKFSSKFESCHSKRRYLANWAMLLCLLGKKLVTVSKIKIYSTLNSLRTLGPQFHDLLYVAWKAFANNLENDALSQMANQILAGMMYLRESNVATDRRVVTLFRDIVINRALVIEDNIHHLHFLDNSTSDIHIHKRMEKVVKTLSLPNPAGFFYQLVDEVGHENSHVRYRAAKKMRRFLQEHILKLNEMKFEEPIFYHCLTKLLRYLLLASKNSTDNEMKSICATCIGYIGALDPNRFDLKEQLSANARFGLTIFTVGETDFTIFFIEELARVLQGSVDTRNFDSCAYCIQEVLRLYKISKADTDPVWVRLSAQTKELLDPLFNSKYSLGARSDQSKKKEQQYFPIYMSPEGQEFKQWLFHWTVSMVECVETETKNFFKIILCIVEHSDQLGMLLLPYVASYAIMEGTDEEKKAILNEINAVIGHWVYEQNMFIDSDTVDESMFEDTPKEANACWEELVEHQKKVESMERNKLKFPYAATQAVFKVLDHLTRLVRNPKLPPTIRRRPGGTCQDSASQFASQLSEMVIAARNHTMEAAKPIADTLDKLCYDVLSKAAFSCHNFARSLMYMEQHLQDNKQDFKRCIGNLQRIYVALYNDDALRGLERMRGKVCSVMEEALTNLSRGKIEECVPSFERIVAQHPDDLVSYQQLVYAFIGLNRVDVSDLLINGCIAQSPEWSRGFDEAKLEICLKQKNFEELARLVELQSNEKLSSWGLSLSKAVLNYNDGNLKKVQEDIDTARTSLITDICSRAAILDMGFYYRHYKDLVRFQQLAEMEETLAIVSRKSMYTKSDRVQHLKFLVNNWNRRLKCVHKSTTIFYPVINFRKTLLDLTKKNFPNEPESQKVLDIAVRDCYVQLEKLESGLGNYNRALELIVESKRYSASSVCYEEGKALFEAGKYEQSIHALRSGITAMDANILNKYKNSTTKNVSLEQIRFSKAALLYAQQMDEQKMVDLSSNSSNYKFAIDVNSRSEKNYFYMACYYDRLWSQAEQRERSSEVQKYMVQNYSSSLEHGCKYIYQSLPRLLTIWFDYSAEIHGVVKSSSVDPSIVLALTESIKKLLANAPTYIFLIAFSQLISRLCHSNTVVWTQLKEILSHMITVHPDQVLWMIINVLKSSYPQRVARCNEILKYVGGKDHRLKTVIRNYKGLADQMITFTMKNPEQSRYLRVSDIAPKLPRLIKSKDFASVLVPFQDFMRPVLPRGGKFVDNHSAFPQELVYICDILEPVQVMASLQRPKRITFVGTNGRKYAMLCKPSDDLRKDSKVMEINNMVHFYMSREKESRKRNLIVRTYHVVPLCDNCGLLEWIRNLHGYKPLINSLYKEGVGHKDGYVKNHRIHQCHRTDSLDRKRSMFKELSKVHPPVMSHWFLKSFEDPQSWYLARGSFVKTSAVTSIIGFLMGLGDRHGENILIDSSNGDVVHVDFNCLFNKGETFDWPERVPFRLTKNMINAFGPLGYEGVFRCCCEIVMRSIRNNSSVFLSIIRPFVYDPLREWESHLNDAAKSQIKGEINSARATDHMNNIRDRLLGTSRTMTKERNVALSVEAHVDYLILEATKFDNLCQMYIGWAGFL